MLSVRLLFCTFLGAVSNEDLNVNQRFCGWGYFWSVEGGNSKSLGRRLCALLVEERRGIWFLATALRALYPWRIVRWTLEIKMQVKVLCWVIFKLCVWETSMKCSLWDVRNVEGTGKGKELWGQGYLLWKSQGFVFHSIVIFMMGGGYALKSELD